MTMSNKKNKNKDNNRTKIRMNMKMKGYLTYLVNGSCEKQDQGPGFCNMATWQKGGSIFR